MDKSGGLRVTLAVVLVGAAWGVMYALYPVGLARGGPAWLAALRFDAFLLGAVAVAAWRKVPLRPRGRADWLAILAYAGLNVVAHNLLLMAGTKHAPVALVAMATGLNPLITLLLARLVLPGVRLSWRAGAGLACGFAGVGLLALNGGHGGAAATSWPWALVVLGGVASWSAGSVALKRAGSALPPLALAVWGALLGGAALSVAAFVAEPVPAIDLPYLGAVAFAGLVGGLAAFLAWGAVVRDHGPQRANLASYVSPVAASVTAWALLGQPLRAVHLAAYALVAAGLALALAAPTARTTAPPAAE